MFTLSGWCILNIVRDDDTALSALDSRVARIGDALEKDWKDYFPNIYRTTMNGEQFFFVCHSRNHARSTRPLVDRMLEQIITLAPRTTGVFHMIDDERPGEPAFEVIKIVGPKLVYETDVELAKVDYMDCGGWDAE